MSGTTDGRPLTNEAVFRIEVSLSSRKSSAIVMKTHARLYILDKAQEQTTPTPNAQWKSVAYGAPCIQLMRETTEHNSPFHIKVVIAEVESGISLWEAELTETSGYNAMQNNFHTFSSNGKTFAVQFASDSEGQRMLESIHDLFVQKQKAETVAFGSTPDQAIFKRPKGFKRLNKKDISTPCNFKHVSGITVQRTQVCEDELRGTIQRKMRSMSLSSLVTRRTKPSDENMMDASPSGVRKGTSKSILNKFGSLRVNKKKGGEEMSMTRDDKRMSLPSHYRKQTRPPLNTTTFAPSTEQRKSPSRSLSLSSSDLPALSPRRQPSGSNLERRHTIVMDPQSRSQYNYVPYSRGRSPRHQLGPKQFSSDVQLNRVPPNSEPSIVRIPSSGVPPPAQVALQAHYQVPHSKLPSGPVPHSKPPSGPVPHSKPPSGPVHNKVIPTYQTPQSNTYQVPTNNQQVPTHISVHYQVPQSKTEHINRAGNPVPYAIARVGSQPSLVPQPSQNGRPREVVQISQQTAYDMLGPRQVHSMSPVREQDNSPSHAKAKVGPIESSAVQAFTANGQAPYDTLPQTRDSLASHSSTSVSTQDTFTDVMAKALEQFDSLLQPVQEQKRREEHKQIIQTSL